MLSNTKLLSALLFDKFFLLNLKHPAYHNHLIFLFNYFYLVLWFYLKKHKGILKSKNKTTIFFCYYLSLLHLKYFFIFLVYSFLQLVFTFSFSNYITFSMFSHLFRCNCNDDEF